MPRARLPHLGEPPAHGPAGVVVVLKEAGAAGEIRDGLGMLRVQWDGGAQHVVPAARSRS